MSVDMSASAVTARLRQVSELRRLCLSLAKAKPVDAAPEGDAKNPSPAGPCARENPEGESPSAAGG